MAEYPKDFLEAADDLIDNWEGGYKDDPDDPGGETKFGITRRFHPTVDIAKLTRDDAIAIYYRDYWRKYRLDEIADPQMRAKIFNMGVLMGMKTALLLKDGCNNITQYRLACVRHFEALAISHPMLTKYLKGWIRRALA